MSPLACGTGWDGVCQAAERGEIALGTNLVGYLTSELSVHLL